MESKLKQTAQKLDEAIEMIYWLLGDESEDDKGVYYAMARERMENAVTVLLNAANFIAELNKEEMTCSQQFTTCQQRQ